MLTNTAAAFKRAYRLTIKSRSTAKNWVTMLKLKRAVHRWNSSSSSLIILILLVIDDTQSLEGAFVNLLSIVLPQLNSYCSELVFGVFF